MFSSTSKGSKSRAPQRSMQATPFLREIIKIDSRQLLSLVMGAWNTIFEKENLKEIVVKLTKGSVNHPLIDQIQAITLLHGVLSASSSNDPMAQDAMQNVSWVNDDLLEYFLEPEKALRKLNKERDSVRKERDKIQKAITAKKKESKFEEAQQLIDEYRDNGLNNTLIDNVLHRDRDEMSPEVLEAAAYVKDHVGELEKNLSDIEAELSSIDNKIRKIKEMSQWTENQCSAKKDRNILHSVVREFAERYPEAITSKSQAKQLTSFSQLLFCLMMDTVAVLRALIEENHYQVKEEGEFEEIIAAIQDTNSVFEQYLPQEIKLADVTALQNAGNLLRFLQELETTPRSVTAKDVMIQNDQKADPNEENALSPQQECSNFFEMKKIQRRTTNHSSYNTSDNDNSSDLGGDDRVEIGQVNPTNLNIEFSDESNDTGLQLQENNQLLPLPAYLAKSLMRHLGDALTKEVKNAQDTNLQRKSQKLEIISDWLRATNTPPLTSLREIYAIDSRQVEKDATTRVLAADESLLKVLHIQRGDYKPSTFSRTLFAAGQAFINENPASLMRRYIFLTHAMDIITFADKKHEEIATKHLDSIYYQQKQLRKLLNSWSENKNAVEGIKDLAKLAKQHPSLEIMARFFSIVFLDQFTEKNLTDLNKATRGWLLDEKNSSNAMPEDKLSFIKVAAKNLYKNNETVSQHSIGAWVAALFEIACFQQKRYPEDSPLSSNYTYEEHHKKLENLLSSLAWCLENYFEQHMLLPHKSVLEMQTLVLNMVKEESSQSAIENTADKTRFDKYHIRLRLINNLPSYWQATIAWIAAGYNPIAALSLALVKNHTGEHVLTLIPTKETKNNYASQVIALLSKADGKDNNKKLIDKYEAIFKDMTAKEKGKYYKAIVQYAETFLIHLKTEQADENAIDTDGIVNLFLAVRDSIAHLKNVIFRREMHHSYNENVDLKIIESLERRINIFTTEMIKISLVEKQSSSKSIEAIQKKLEELGQNEIYDPSISGFKEFFNQQLELESFTGHESYFFKVFFTQGHRFNQTHVDNVELVCKALYEKIIDKNSTPDTYSEAWESLAEKFYNNSEALEKLIQSEETEKADKLRVAIFGMNNLESDDNKFLFAKHVLSTFSEILSAERADIVWLEKALNVLKNQPHFISAEEVNALEKLQNFIETRRPKEEEEPSPFVDAYDDLQQIAQEQKIVQTIYTNNTEKHDQATLLGLPINSLQITEKSWQAAIKMAMNQGNSRKDVSQDDNVSGYIKALDDLVVRITDQCFPVNYRYYKNDDKITRLNKKDYKLTDTETGSGAKGRSLLLQMIRDAIATLLNNNNFTGETLIEAMKKLRTNVLQGSPEEGYIEVLQPMPHDLSEFTVKDLTYYQTDQYINNFINRIKDVAKNIPSNVQEPENGLVQENDLLEFEVVAAQLDPEQIQKMVLATVEWLKSASPDMSNIPPEVQVTGLTQEIINQYRKKVLFIGDERKFERRVRLLRDDKLTQCLDDILHDLNMGKVSDARLVSVEPTLANNLHELHRFVKRLDEYINGKPKENIKLRYQQYRNQFLWVAAEYAIKNNAMNTFIVLQCLNYDWDSLLEFGIEKCAHLSVGKNERLSPELINTLVYLSKNFNCLLNSAWVFIQKVDQEEEDITPLVKGLVGDALARIDKLLGLDQQLNDDSDVYYHLYTLLKTTMRISIIQGRARKEMENQELMQAINRAQLLLMKLHAKLKEPEFFKWHRRMLRQSENQPSFFSALVRREEHTDALRNAQLMKPSKEEDNAILTSIDRLPYYWTRYYRNGSTSYRVSSAYEATFSYALHWIMDSEKIVDFDIDIQVNNETRKQYITKLEQQNLVFMAAKDFYSNIDKSPAINSLYLLAAGQVEDSKEKTEIEATKIHEEIQARSTLVYNKIFDIIPALLEKACDSFNEVMALNKVDTDQQNKLLTRKIIEWIKEIPAIQKVYLKASAKNISSIKHVNFLFSLFETSEIEGQVEMEALKQAALNQAFLFMYENIEKKRGSSLFSSFTTDLSNLLKDIVKYKLCENYYCYIAKFFPRYIESNSGELRFANTYQVPDKARDEHVNQLLMFLNNNDTASEEIRNTVTSYIVDSWFSYAALFNTEKEKLNFYTEKDLYFIGFYLDYRGQDREGKMHNKLPKVVKNALDEFKKKMWPTENKPSDIFGIFSNKRNETQNSNNSSITSGSAIKSKGSDVKNDSLSSIHSSSDTESREFDAAASENSTDKASVIFSI